MKNKSIGILILSLLGYFLILLSIFFLYQGINSTQEEIQVTKNELDKAKKKIEKLSNQLVEKNSLNKKADSTVFRNSDGFNAMLGKNIPLIEITDLDLLHKRRWPKRLPGCATNLPSWKYFFLRPLKNRCQLCRSAPQKVEVGIV